MALTEQKVLEDKKQVELVCSVGPEDFEKAVQRAFLRENKKIQLPGFRKGKATRQMIEKRFGESFFYEDAANDLLLNATKAFIAPVLLENGEKFFYGRHSVFTVIRL